VVSMDVLVYFHGDSFKVYCTLVLSFVIVEQIKRPKLLAIKR